jgi:hypothetical protein
MTAAFTTLLLNFVNIEMKIRSQRFYVTLCIQQHFTIRIQGYINHDYENAAFTNKRTHRKQQ